jgi:hypothetical protein
MLTFDDAITITNHPFYEELFGSRVNPNGAPITGTFFISHEYTNYSLVNDLWVKGHDIALHSITHVSDTGYWSRLNESGWQREIVNQREQLSRFSGVPQDYIKGVRAPFLQIGGNSMYKAFSDGGLVYDCSRPTQNYRKPGLWPYTNDYASIQDCQIPTCPTDAFPGFWTAPMIDLIGDDEFPCAMVDECTPVPTTQDATYQLLVRNFEDHYNSDYRAPFGVYTHAAWLVGPVDRPEFAERKAGYLQFVDFVLSKSDVFVVGVSQMLEWVKSPVEMSAINDFDAWKQDTTRTNAGCRFPRNCRYANQTYERFMSSCVACPPEYPWVDNHLGTFKLDYDSQF